MAAIRLAALWLLSSSQVMAASLTLPPTLTFWPSAEFQTFGDSIFSGPGGMTYAPASPIPITGTLTAGSTSIGSVSSLVGLQVGAYLYGTGIPSNSKIISIAGTGITTSAAATTSGNSNLFVQANVTNTLATGAQMNSLIGWLDALSGNALYWNPATGYTGNSGGINKITVVNPGTNYAAVSAWQIGPPDLYSGNAAGSFTCTGAGGAIQSCSTPSSAGSGYTFPPTLTCTNGCGTGATLGTQIGGSGTLASPGDTTTQILARTPDACAARPAWVLMDGGTNDIAQGVPAGRILSNIAAITQQLRTCGVRVVLFKVFPRRTWNSLTGYTVAQAQSTLESVNRGIGALGRQAYASNPASPALLIVDANRYLTDAANSTNPGFALQGLMPDGLHPGLPAAFWMAVAAKQVLAPWLPQNPPAQFGQDDFFDPLYNPSGNLLGSQGLFATSGGGSAGPCTGSVATGWSVNRQGTASSMSCQVAIENPRSDGLSGQRQTLSLSASSTAATPQPEVLQLVNTSIPPSNISKGDKLEASCEINISKYVNVDRLGLVLLELSPSGLSYNQYMYALDGSGIGGFVLPSYSTLSQMPLQGTLPGFTQNSIDGAFDVRLRTMAPITAQAIPGGAYYFYIELGYESSVAETGTGATVKVSNCAVRKVI